MPYFAHCMFLILAFSLAVPLQDTVDQGNAKPAPPSRAAQRDAEKSIKELFKADYARGTPEALSQLARKLIEAAADSANEGVVRYVLLKEARDAALQAAELGLALEAVDAITAAFAVDGIQEKSDLLKKIASRLRSVEGAAELAEAYLALSAEAMNAGQPDAAVSAAGKAEGAARGAREKGLQERARAVKARASFVRTEFNRIKRHQKTLEKSPDDPDANAAVGKYVCFVANDWDAGLPMLAKGGDETLKRLARNDLGNPADEAARRGLADAWWNQAEKERKAEIKATLRGRAYHWYTLAVPEASGLAKAKIVQRLRTATSFLPSPVAQQDRSPAIGGPGGAEFSEVPQNSLLVGFRIHEGQSNGTIVKALQAVYEAKGRRVLGEVYGKPAGGAAPTELIAKTGYAVGAVVAKQSTRVHGFKVVFMRIRGLGLDTADTYESKWVAGTQGDMEIRLDGEGAYVVGVYGKSYEDLDSMGLVFLK